MSDAVRIPARIINERQAISAGINPALYKAYMHIRYAPNGNPTDAEMSITPNDFMGVYCGNATAPLAASSYIWARINSAAVQAAVEAAKTAAVAAQTGAETAKTSADTAKAAAVVAQTGAKAAQTGAEAAQAGTKAIADSILGAQANALTLAAGSAATAETSVVGGKLVIALGIPKGDTGAQGAQGIKGDTGAQGVQGIKGDTGAQGIQGVKGDTGAQGIQGAKGDTGTPGMPICAMTRAEYDALGVPDGNTLYVITG
ncbi:MAG: collagen-like protein [Clostridia bacterium]